MASLLGKADPTLARFAYAAGMANVPGDYSKQFGIMADASKTLLEGVEKAWTTYETKKKADQKALDDGIKELRNYGITIENNADSKKFNGEMDGQVGIWNENDGFKNDRPGLNEWQRQNNKIMSKYKNNQVTMTETLEAWESSDAWKEGMTNGELDENNIWQNDTGFLTNLVDYVKNVGDKSGIHNEKADNYMANNTGEDTDKKSEDLWKHLGTKDGEVVKYLDPATNEFTYITSVDGHVIVKKSSEVSKMIPSRDKDGEADIWTQVNSIPSLAKNKTHSYDDYNSSLNQTTLEKTIDERQINNPRALEYLMDQKYGSMTESFTEALKKGTAITTPAIIASLEGLNMGYKDDGDKVFEREDFAKGSQGEANYQAMVQSILKDEKNYKLRRDLFVDHVDEMAFRPAWDNNKGTPKVDSSGDGTKTSGIIKKKIKLGPLQNWGAQANVEPEIANSMLESIKTGTHFPFMGNLYDFDEKDNKWVETNAKSKEETRRFDSAQELSDNVFITPHPAFQNLETKVDKVVDPKTGKIIKEVTTPTTGFKAEDFMQEDELFLEAIDEEYDLSDYIVQETRDWLVGEVWYGSIEITSRSDPSKKWRFRTNYSSPKKAQKAAIKWNKWIKNQGIELKAIPL